MEMINYSSLAMEAFEKKDYELCVRYLILDYDAGENREEILEFIYSNFITPNEEEFQKSYAESSQGFSQIAYETLTIDFIPVAEEKFYIYNKIEKNFKGLIDTDKMNVEEPLDNNGFDDFIFSDIWDLRLILPFAKENPNQIFYLISNDMNKTASFAKIPNLVKNNMKNMVLLQDLDMFETFFSSYPDIYIPKQLFASNSAEKIEESIIKLHNARITDTKQERNTIFLSICIPSWNRGNRALKAVQNIQNSLYDSEIEIVVSSNCSTIKTDGYEQIKKMQDSRINYYESPKHLELSENILQVLKMAKGEFAVLCSDEDSLILDELPFYLALLKDSPQMGILLSGGQGVNFSEEEFDEPVSFQNYLFGMLFAMKRRYLTGICYNMRIMKQTRCLEFLEELPTPYLISHYPHLLINAIMSHRNSVYYCTRKLWDSGEDEEKRDYEGNDLFYHFSLEGRKREFKEWMKIFSEVIAVSSKELVSTYYSLYEELYHLMDVAMYWYPKSFERYAIDEEYILEEIFDFAKTEVRLIQSELTELELRELLDMIDKKYADEIAKIR